MAVPEVIILYYSISYINNLLILFDIGQHWSELVTFK